MDCPPAPLLSNHRAASSGIDARSSRRVYAAIDLGTNNCRMLIATAAEGGFRVIEAFSRITRLGEGLAQTGQLSISAMERTILALRHCARRMARAGVTDCRVVATEACRQASNCADFTRTVQRATGLRLEIIPAEEEARLAFGGCAALLSPEIPNALVFDIGGGSTELIWREKRHGQACHDVLSLPVGVVTLTECRGADLNSLEGYRAIVADLAANLRQFDARHGIAAHIRAGQAEILGTSGTVTTLAGVHLGLMRYDRSKVDGLSLSFEDLSKISRSLAAMSLEERAAHPCIGQDRADLLVAGCAILQAICDIWPFEWIKIADRGVREGILLSLIQG